jgi:hypothetical protein
VGWPQRRKSVVAQGLSQPLSPVPKNGPVGPGHITRPLGGEMVMSCVKICSYILAFEPHDVVDDHPANRTMQFRVPQKLCSALPLSDSWENWEKVYLMLQISNHSAENYSQG